MFMDFALPDGPAGASAGCVAKRKLICQNGEKRRN
jgi:hypothetical protein